MTYIKIYILYYILYKYVLYCILYKCIIYIDTHTHTHTCVCVSVYINLCVYIHLSPWNIESCTSKLHTRYSKVVYLVYIKFC